MGWLILLILALLTAAALWRWIAVDKGALQFLGAALLIALAGYAWQGRPGMAGAPKPPPGRQALPDTDFKAAREEMFGRFTRAEQWLMLADRYHRAGDTRGAVGIIRSGLRQNPEDANLWVGLGNALVLHADGMMSPAAQLAFGRANALAPNHPGPRFFYGLALAQSGDFDGAEDIWRALVAEAPADADYTRQIADRLAAIDQARAMGQLPPRAPRPAAGPEAAPQPTP
jgi:cytochrome c-type biogenesis protein CcmH